MESPPGRKINTFIDHCPKVRLQESEYVLVSCKIDKGTKFTRIIQCLKIKIVILDKFMG